MISEKNAASFKTSKEKAMLLAAANASGSQTAICDDWKSSKTFENLNMESVTVKYRSQKNPWMTSDIFLDWFMKEFVPAVKHFLKKKKKTSFEGDSFTG